MMFAVCSLIGTRVSPLRTFNITYSYIFYTQYHLIYTCHIYMYTNIILVISSYKIQEVHIMYLYNIVCIKYIIPFWKIYYQKPVHSGTIMFFYFILCENILVFRLEVYEKEMVIYYYYTNTYM